MSWPLFMSLRSTPLESNFDQKISAPDAGSSPRKPGSLLMEVANMSLRSKPLGSNSMRDFCA